MPFEKPFFGLKPLNHGMKKRIVILGAGESGVGAALLARQKHYDVFVSDGSLIKDAFKNELIVNKVDFEEGKHTGAKILDADIVVKSPGISETNVMVRELRKRDIEILSEIEFAYRYKDESKIVAVTGSNGKTTTTAMIYHICKEANLDCAMVGNIGYSFARQIAAQPRKLYVAEISSFQLDDIKFFRPDVAVLTNITEDHLDRYDNNFKNYIKSKFNIIKNQTESDVFIYNEDDEITVKYLNNFLNKTNPLPFSMNKPLPQGAYISNAAMHMRWRGGST
jgi:UDP-N-acetylmuramoylalanine--D-glutamate ligase